MDFIKGLPHSHGKSIIFVVVDRLSKYANFVVLSHPYTVASISHVFVKEIACLHVKSIITNRGKVFLRQFWQEFF